jgi:glycosyltransferase involved in cell wall biosynthesis
MVLDEGTWTPPDNRGGAAVRVGWSGGPANLPYLEAIEPALIQVQAQSPNVEFVVHCGEAPRFTSLRYTHERFVAGQEPATVKSFDIGLAPLPDNEFAAAKSPIKCIQYMASGVATIVSPIGAARSMFVEGKTGIFARSLEDWQSAIATLADDPKLRPQIGANARAEFEATYALGSRVPVLADILRSL